MNHIRQLSQSSKSKSPLKGHDRRLICEVLHLDPALPHFKASIKIDENASVLFNKVCDTFGGILEKDYFGLNFIDQHGQKQWLELNRSISKQIKDKSHGNWVQVFNFRFKHYPKDPMNDLQQDLSKYLLYLQLRHDLYTGRLVASLNCQYRMVALILQAESEGYDMLDTEAIPLADLNLLPSIKRKDELSIISIYETIKDLEPYEAEKLFLQEASKLDTYGVELVPVKDQKENDLFVGVTYDGVSTYSDSRKMHTFPWNSILKISFIHKLFMFKVIVEKKKHVLGFKCKSSHAACALWKMSLDRKWFITLDRASEARRSTSGGSLFRRKKTHTFSGRSQRELTSSCQTLPRIPQPQVIRTHSMMTLLKCTTSRSDSANVNGNPTSIGSTGYSTLPLSPEKLSFFSESSDEGELSKRSSKENSLRNKPSAAAIGNVVEIMGALRETPIPEIESRKNSDTEFDIQNIENSSVESKNINLDDENNLFSEMIEIVERESQSILQSCPTDVKLSEIIPSDKSSEVTSAMNDDNSKSICQKKHLDSGPSVATLSAILICATIVFGILKFIFVKIME